MRRARLAWCAIALVLGAARAGAADLDATLKYLSQVRDGDLTRQTEFPNQLYGHLGAYALPYESEIEGFFRAGYDFGLGRGGGDLYLASARVPGAVEGLDLTVGRQWLNESLGGALVADGGTLRVGGDGPLQATVFGGVPRYFEPTYGVEKQSQNESVFGGSIEDDDFGDGRLEVGYFQQYRKGKTLRQLVSANVTQEYANVVGRPNFYGSFAFDASQASVDFGNVGVNLVFDEMNLRFNLEGNYYQPQDRGRSRPEIDINRREDGIFELFSVSEMWQVRTGLRYQVNPEISAYADYSFQDYASVVGEREVGHVASVGAVWLPENDGLELVRAEYYVADSGGGNVNGGKVLYENRVYEQLTLRAKLDLAYYDKATNQNGIAFSSLLGVAYEVAEGVTCGMSLEALHNRRFDADIRVGFGVIYEFGRWTLPLGAAGRTQS